MGVREYDYIKGNTAIVPERQIKEREVKVRNKQEKKKKLAEKRKNLTKDFAGIILLMFVLGGTSLAIDGHVFALQKELSNLEIEVNKELEINEALKVNLLQISSIEKIKTTAEKELGMVYPGKTGTISIDMSKEYFSHIKEKSESDSSLIGKIIGTFN
jgi:cell division protein FtsL